MKNLKVSMKLILGFMVVVVLAIAVGVVGIIGMDSINRADDALYNENVIALSAMGDIRETLQAQIVQIRTMVLNAGDAVKLQGIKVMLSSLEYDMETYFGIYEGTITDDSLERAYFEARDLYRNEFSDIKQRVYEASQISFEAAYDVIYDPRVQVIRDTMVNAFFDSMEQNDAWALESVNNNTSLFMTMLVTSLTILGFTIAVALFLAFYISSLISKPLKPLAAFMSKAGMTGDIVLDPADVEVIGKYSQVKDEIGQAIQGAASFVSHVAKIAEELKAVAAGDLTTDVVLLSEADTMGQSVRTMVDSLNQMFTEIQHSTDQVSTGANQISDGAQALAQGTTQQAASIEQLSSSIAEISQRTKENAVTADEA